MQTDRASSGDCLHLRVAVKVRKLWPCDAKCVSSLLSHLGEMKTRNLTYKLSLQLALAATAWLALERAP